MNKKTILLGLRSERKDLEIRAQEAYDNEKPKEAIDLVEQIKKLDERITKLEDEIKTIKKLIKNGSLKDIKEYKDKLWRMRTSGLNKEG